MPKHSTSQKIDFNIDKGLKLKATIQLASLINKNPNDIEFRNRLAMLYYKAGFLDAAGKFWILNDSKEKYIRECVELYEKTVNYSGNKILNDIKFKGNKSLLNSYAQDKIKKLEEDSLTKTNYIPTFTNVREKLDLPIRKTPIQERVGCTVAVII